jgi:hypothetical protein
LSKQLTIFDGFSIEPYKNQKEIVEKTALQIIKDFALFGMKIELKEGSEWNYDELFKQLQPAIEKLMHTDYPRLLSLLYQIDLGPAEINKARTEQPELSDSELMPALIIYREFKKVVFRMYYTSKSIKK